MAESLVPSLSPKNIFEAEVSTSAVGGDGIFRYSLVRGDCCDFFQILNGILTAPGVYSGATACGQNSDLGMLIFPCYGPRD